MRPSHTFRALRSGAHNIGTAVAVDSRVDALHPPGGPHGRPMPGQAHCARVPFRRILSAHLEHSHVLSLDDHSARIADSHLR